MQDRASISIRILRKRFVRALIVFAIVLIILSVAGHVAKSYFPSGYAVRIFNRFSLDVEWSVPTWYSTILLLTVAVLACVNALAVKQLNGSFLNHWRGLTIIFLFLSIDEAAGIHEMANPPLKALFGLGGWLRFAWVIPAFILVSIFVVAYWEFIRKLMPRVRNQFILAIVIFVTGALGLEILSAGFLKSNEFADTGYIVLSTLEESLEMFGVILMINALMELLDDKTYEVPFRASPTQL